MMTRLPAGEYIAYRRKQRTEYAQVVAADVPNEKWILLLGDETQVPMGSIVHHGVWKTDADGNEEFVTRRFSIRGEKRKAKGRK